MPKRTSGCRQTRQVPSGTVHRRRPLRFEALEDRRLLTAVIGNNIAVGTELRNYRIAIAATGEYTAFHGGVSEALGAIQQVVADLNKIYEPELAIHLNLVSGTNVIYVNPATDPFTSGYFSAMLDENQVTLDSVIGDANYDAGHVFDYVPGGGGGLSFLGVVGWSLWKANGATGSYNPQGPLFVSLVAHELGHQFGADHTFNSTLAGTPCAAQREATNAYEPASGSTLMSYAGICPPDDSQPSDNLQADPDRVFHSASFEQIQEYIDPANHPYAAPYSTTPLSNSIPVVNGGSDLTVPARTPFELTATGTDADAGDGLTYSWEELDLGPSQSLPLSDNGSSPLFRAFAPSTDATRVLPRLPDLLANASTAPKGEVLPTTTRNLNFRVTVRDGQGGVNSDDLLLNVVDTGAAFEVTAPNSAVTWTGGTLQTITWSAAGTTGNGINAAVVNILLSTDGGQTFPFTLATTANDGSHQITVPNFNTTTAARIKIQAAGNVFFDVSDQDLTINSDPASAGVTVAETDGGTRVFEQSTTDTYTLALNTVPTAGAVTFQIFGGSQMEISLDGIHFATSQAVSLGDTTARLITVRALNDSTPESLHKGRIAHSITSSSSPEYPVGSAISGITATISDDELPPLVGIDFQPPDDPTPLNWTEVELLENITYSNLLREDGVGTQFDLTISHQATSATYSGESVPLSYTVPAHNPGLSDLGGLLTNYNDAQTPDIDFTWKGLTAGGRYGVYVFVVEWFGDYLNADQTVTITGSGVDDPAPFVQNTMHKEGILLVNGEDGDDGRSVHSYAHVVTADANGLINIHIAANDAANNPEVYIAGLAIHEVEVLPTVTLSVDSATIAENAGVATFTATLSAVSGLPVTVDLGFTGTATLTDDYTPSGTQIVIAAGSLSGSVTVTAVQDTLGELDETVIVDITEVTGGTESGTQLQTVTISDGDVAEVVARRLFYNNSKWDGNNTAANAADDGAIAPDKQALIDGQKATFANYTSYDKGLNGLMIDVLHMPGTPTVNDFVFRVGNSNTPYGNDPHSPADDWPWAPAPTSITVRTGAGLDGADRVTLIWADGALKNRWLQVTMLATDSTGLATNEVFYVGNAVGESGSSPSDALVNATDEIGARNNPHSPFAPALVDDRYDYNRDKLVNATDQIIARNNRTSPFTALKLITPPVAPATIGSHTVDEFDRSTTSRRSGVDLYAPLAASSPGVGRVFELAHRPSHTKDAAQTIMRSHYVVDDHCQVVPVKEEHSHDPTQSILRARDQRGPAQWHTLDEALQELLAEWEQF